MENNYEINRDRICPTPVPAKENKSINYNCTNSTLTIKGTFRAVSTGIDGGIKNVTSLINHTVPKDFDHDRPLEYIQKLLTENNCGPDAFALLTAVWMQDLCIIKNEYITVFVTAGVSNPNPDPVKPHTINIIVVSEHEFTDSALLETIITVTEAKAHALRLLDRDFTGTTSDAVIVACESGKIKHEYAGTFTDPGKKIYASVLHGVTESIKRHEGTVMTDKPSYFVYSETYKTFRWMNK